MKKIKTLRSSDKDRLGSAMTDLKEPVTLIDYSSEELLRSSNAQFRSLFESMPIGIGIADLQGSLLAFNDAALEMSGYIRADLEQIGNVVALYYDSKQRKEVLALFEKQGFLKGYETQFKHKDGTLYYVLLSLTHIIFNGTPCIQAIFEDITERKQAEKTLHKEEEKYRNIFENAMEAIIQTTPEGKIITANPAAARMLGYNSPKELITSLADLNRQFYVELGRREEFISLMEKLGNITGFESEVYRKDGSKMWISENSHAVRDENGTLLGYKGTAQDITERKRAEEQLASSEAELRTLFANMMDVVIVYDADGRYVEIAPTNPSKLYLPPDDILGKTVHEILPKESADIIVSKIHEALQSNQPVNCEYALLIGGKEAWFFASASPLSEDTVIWVAHDITERKQAEEALRASEEKFVKAFQSSPDAILITRLGDGLIIDVNEGFCRLTGYDRDQALGHSTQQLGLWLDPQDRDRFAALMQKEGRVKEREYRFRMKDGQVRDALLSGEMIRLGNEQYFLSIVRDITERKRDEDILQRAEEKYRTIFSESNEGIFQSTPAGQFFTVNPALAHMLGYDLPEELISNIKDISSQLYVDAERRDEFMKLMRENDQVNAFESKMRRRDGKTIWVSESARAVRDEFGTLLHYEGQIENVTDRKQAEAAIQEHLAELQMLYESGLTLSQLLSPKEIAQKLIELMSSKLDWHHTTVRLYHPEDETFELLAFNLPGTRSTAELQEAEQRFKTAISKAEAGLSRWSVQHKQIVRVGDLSHDPRYIETTSNMHSGMYVPLKVGERVAGVISIESEKPEAFSEADERLTITLANQAAIALENARLHQETMHHLNQLQALHTIDQAIAASFDQRTMLEVLLTQTLSQLDAEAAAIFLIQPHQKGALQYVAGQGFNTGLIQIASLKLGNSIAGEAVVKREMIHIRELEEGGSNPILSKLWSEEGFRCMDAVPLISKGEVKGVLTVFHRKDFTPKRAWSSFLETLAGQAAIAIDVTQMFDNLQRANLELAVAYEATIEGWSQAMDLRDKETEGHSQRVTEMTIHMGKALQLSDEDIVNMRRGALLHDIGKLGVPDHILLKVEKLTDEEWLIMKKHPEFAYDMLHSIAYLRGSLDIPYCHHEKWDGTGYPQGLKGEQIPLAARIFAVVDVWDALISERSYRQTWSRPDALQYIREQSGKYFDPQVVDVFLKEFGNE